MTELVSVYQPRYFPRLHYLSRAQQSDTFVLFDTVEFSRRSRQHRTEVDFQNKKWLTIPVKHDGNHTRIMDAQLDMSSRWPTKHRKTLHHKFGPPIVTYDEIYHDIEYEGRKLIDVTIPTLRKLFADFDIDTTIVRASDVDVSRNEDPSQYIAQLVMAVGGDSYLCGKHSYEQYLREQPFDEREIDIELQDWAPNWHHGNVNALEVLSKADDPSRYVQPTD